MATMKQERPVDGVWFWIDLLQAHLDETGHEEGFDYDLGPFCQTCADKEA